MPHLYQTVRQRLILFALPQAIVHLVSQGPMCGYTDKCLCFHSTHTNPDILQDSKRLEAAGQCARTAREHISCLILYYGPQHLDTVHTQ